MAGFFSLGGGGRSNNVNFILQDRQPSPPSSSSNPAAAWVVMRAGSCTEMTSIITPPPTGVSSYGKNHHRSANTQIMCSTIVLVTRLVARAEGFSAQPMSRAPGFLLLRGARGFNNNKKTNSIYTQKITKDRETTQVVPPSSSALVYPLTPYLLSPASENWYAYQTAVNIGGHLFTGILYDQGSDDHYMLSPGAGTSSSGGLNLIAATSNPPPPPPPFAAAAASTCTAAMAAGSPPFIHDPSHNVYQPPLNTSISGAHFFPHPSS
ncbi:hypothetical protein Acr_05g0014900 [Actinidia rufa]|uniref:Uncharacterized protein n=1 Tax=Actinidia rufa TaxID=165716 RepID=A0A7J0EMZ7_9ERIC|nr:hypothetical protein Acr_05g0014900 [Actinidia rufa]